MSHYLLVFLALSQAAVTPSALAQQLPQAATRLAYQDPAAPPPAPIAPLADKECEGFDAKHCLRQEMTGCPFDLVEPGMGCRTIYSKDPDDIIGLLGVVRCDEQGCRGLDEIETYRFKQGAILNNRRQQHGPPWESLLAGDTLDQLSGIDPGSLSPESRNPPNNNAEPSLEKKTASRRL